MNDDPLLAKLIEMQQKLDAALARLDELEQVFKRYIELTNRIIGTGEAPSPPPRVN